MPGVCFADWLQLFLLQHPSCSFQGTSQPMTAHGTLSSGQSAVDAWLSQQHKGLACPLTQGPSGAGWAGRHFPRSALPPDVSPFLSQETWAPNSASASASWRTGPVTLPETKTESQVSALCHVLVRSYDRLTWSMYQAAVGPTRLGNTQARTLGSISRPPV